jgi:hypothetical protein
MLIISPPTYLQSTTVVLCACIFLIIFSTIISLLVFTIADEVSRNMMVPLVILLWFVTFITTLVVFSLPCTSFQMIQFGNPVSQTQCIKLVGV